MTTRNVYIAGRITGVDNFRQSFDDAERSLRDDGWVTYNPVALDDTLGKRDYGSCLRLDLSILLTLADAIYLLPGWSKSRGARAAEYAVAEVIGLDMLGAVDELAHAVGTPVG